MGYDIAICSRFNLIYCIISRSFSSKFKLIKSKGVMNRLNEQNQGIILGDISKYFYVISLVALKFYIEL